MKFNNHKDIYNQVRYSLINLNKNNNLLKYEPLFTLYDSVINNKPIKNFSNYKVANNKNFLTSRKDLKNKNLINQIIKEKLDHHKVNLFHKNNKYIFIKPIENDEISTKNNSTIYNPKNMNIFLTNTKSNTNTYIQTTKRNNSENEKVIHAGKCINDILIKNINDEMINKGILVQRPFTSKRAHKNTKNPRKNFNNWENHLAIFEPKIKKEFEDYLKEYKLAQKKSLRSISKKLAIRKEKMTKSIPIYIKGFKKDNSDVFHSRKIFDLEYQKLYSKPSINIEEIFHYQNKNSNYNFRQGKIPFYYFLRTVSNPYDKKTFFKNRPNSDKKYIEFNGEEIKKN